MVHYEDREKNRIIQTYAVKDPGEITLDNQVGIYLFKRAEAYPKGTAEIAGKRKKFSDLLNEFEAGQMTKRVYEILLSRKVKSASQVLRKQNIKELVNLESLTQEESEKLKAIESAQDLKDFINNYYQVRISQLPQISTYREELLEATKKGNLEELTKILAGFRSVINSKIDHYYRNMLKYPENAELYEQYCKSTQTGNIFSMGSVLFKLREKYPERE